MSPKITISQGERQTEVELSDGEIHHVLKALEDYSVNRLIDPKTRQPYETEAPTDEKLRDLRKAIIEIQHAK